MDIDEILTAAENAPPEAAIDVVAAGLRRNLGATAVSFLLTDFSGHSVVRLAAIMAPTVQVSGCLEELLEAERIPLADTLYDQVLRTQRRYRRRLDNGSVQVLAPVTNRGDSIGILEVVCPDDPAPATLDRIGRTAHALAYVVIANRRFTDLYEWGRRSTPLALAAEVQHQLLPLALTCESNQFTVSGALEPAHNIGGDTFDFALDRDAVHLSLTDVMGHDVEAALGAALLLAALRGGRRVGAGLEEQARRADAAMREHHNIPDLYATGQLIRVDLRSGLAHIVNAGHLPPLRLREGHVEEVLLEPDLPFGIPFPHSYTAQPFKLRPGDRVMLLTDGMLGSGVDLPGLMVSTRDLHPRQAALALTGAVFHANDGRLRDDATVLCLDWYGIGRPPRDADTGADLTLASPATGL
ncbi:PP2C family protein-serine/threonine phosphatase [Thermopolyspora sp. NPDC052614]|uniref:PP2C family protein-serine/threonine phosphatase n=1 Tax=Thermopolyspora sp. NPDC052614 TaxID=3155682 RepID=UPI00344374E3